MINRDKKTKNRQMCQKFIRSKRTTIPVLEFYDRCRAHLQELLNSAFTVWRIDPSGTVPGLRRRLRSLVKKVQSQLRETNFDEMYRVSIFAA